MIILIGPSASGKTEICKELTSSFHYKKFVTTTTRPIRNNEINGIDYNFVTVDTFKKMISNNEFIEFTQYNDNYYGTEKKYIDDNTVLIVESNGLISFKNSSIDNIYAYFLKIDENIRIERMEKRGDSKESIHSRVLHDRFKFNKDIEKYVDVIIEEKSSTIKELAAFINNDYKNKIKK